MQLGLKKDEVVLVPHCSEWKKEFQTVKQEIIRNTRLPEKQIEHIGSTAIEGIESKPVLDIAVGVEDLKAIDKAIFQGLKEIGFLRLRVERPNEIVLAKFTDETYLVKTHYIHLVEYDSDLWSNLIFFRDYLRENQSAREEYENLKKAFLQNGTGGINEYTNHKEQFVRDIYAKRIHG